MYTKPQDSDTGLHGPATMIKTVADNITEVHSRPPGAVDDPYFVYAVTDSGIPALRGRFSSHPDAILGAHKQKIQEPDKKVVMIQAASLEAADDLYGKAKGIAY